MQRHDFGLPTSQNSSLAGDIPCTHLSAAEQASDSQAPCLMVVPSVFGVDPTFLLHARRFVDAGMQVYALDSFWRTCPGPLPLDKEGMKQAMQRMEDLQDSDCDGDVSELVRHIRGQHKNSRLIALGICFGGRPVVRSAIDGDVDAVASWHGVRIGSLADELGTLACPASLHFGAIDALTPAQEISQINAALAERSNSAPLDLQVHDDCDHGFTHLDRPQVFNSQAYEAAFSGLLKLV